MMEYLKFWIARGLCEGALLIAIVFVIMLFTSAGEVSRAWKRK